VEFQHCISKGENICARRGDGTDRLIFHWPERFGAWPRDVNCRRNPIPAANKAATDPTKCSNYAALALAGQFGERTRACWGVDSIDSIAPPINNTRTRPQTRCMQELIWRRAHKHHISAQKLPSLFVRWGVALAGWLVAYITSVSPYK